MVEAPRFDHLLVTGGAGFIGSCYVRDVLGRRDGTRITVLDKLTYAGNEANLAALRNDPELAARLTFVRGDIADPAVVGPLVASVDGVVNFAAESHVDRSILDPEAFLATGVIGVHVLLEACRVAERGPRFLQVSTDEVYGHVEAGHAAEDAPLAPRSPYAAAKLSGELYTLSYARAGLIEGVALRYFNVFGPRQDPNGPYAAVVPALFRASVTAQPMGIFGDGLQTRDFTFIDNVLLANVLAATQLAERASGWVVNVGAGTRTSLLELVDLVGEVTGRPIEITHRPPRGGDVRDSLASLERARAILGYEPPVSLKEGLARLWEWLREHPEAIEAPATTAASR